MEDYPKKLIEVALPLEDINAASGREKSIRHGHPSTLHLWWARRPLAAARAVLFGQLVDDPSGYVDELREDKKALKAAEKAVSVAHQEWRERKEIYDRAQEAGRPTPPDPGPEPTIDAYLVQLERERLFNLIRSMVLWENTNNDRVLKSAHREVVKSWKRTCRRNSRPEDTPLPPFLDPFSGGGALPLEAQRLGLEAYATDLNPVAVLINKAMIELPPKVAGMQPVNPAVSQQLASTSWPRATGLAEDVQHYGQWIRDEAKRMTGHLYPPYKLTQEVLNSYPELAKEGYKAGSDLPVIAWLWARTVKCPNPACARTMPLLSSFVLSTSRGRHVYLEPEISKQGDSVQFHIRRGNGTPSESLKKGYKRGTSGIFECCFCGTVTQRDYTAEAASNVGLGSHQTAVVCSSSIGRIYLPAQEGEERKQLKLGEVSALQARLAENPRDVWCRNFGLVTPASLFTERQLNTLQALSSLVTSAGEEARNAGASPEYEKALVTYLGLGVSKTADYNSSLVIWSPSRDQAKSTFARQALPMTWDYAEINPFADAAGDLNTSLAGICRVLAELPACPQGKAAQVAAQSTKSDRPLIVSTDPPYYDNIGYADLSDYFYVWLRQSLGEVYPDLLSTMLSPKAEELVALPYRHPSKAAADDFFLEQMKQVFQRLCDQCDDSIPLTVYYAFKQAEIRQEGISSTGWATFLEAVIGAGLSVAGTWPIRTERQSRTVSIGTNALASSIVLVCRRKKLDAAMATRREFVQALKSELPGALQALQQGNIAPVDLPQASIGPGMAVFSGYSKVVEADGAPMTVKTALQLINHAVDEFLSDQESQMDDWTRFAVAWFSQYGFEPGPFGDADKIARAKNVAVDGVADAGIIRSRGGEVRILKREELDPSWDPDEDDRLTVWEMVHHLIRRLEQGGEDAAAALLKKLGGLSEDARALCYRLFAICEQRKWAEEARDYNMLINSWQELTKLAEQTGSGSAPVQQDLI